MGDIRGHWISEIGGHEHEVLTISFSDCSYRYFSDFGGYRSEVKGDYSIKGNKITFTFKQDKSPLVLYYHENNNRRYLVQEAQYQALMNNWEYDESNFFNFTRPLDEGAFLK